MTSTNEDDRSRTWMKPKIMSMPRKELLKEKIDNPSLSANLKKGMTNKRVFSFFLFFAFFWLKQL